MYLVDAESEDITNATMRGGEGDDVISVVAGDQGDGDVVFINPANIGGSLIGGPGEDTITVGDGLAVLTGTIKGNEDDDSITVANADGGFVQGNSGDDTINIGFAATADDLGPRFGERRAVCRPPVRAVVGGQVRVPNDVEQAVELGVGATGRP